MRMTGLTLTRTDLYYPGDIVTPDFDCEMYDDYFPSELKKGETYRVVSVEDVRAKFGYVSEMALGHYHCCVLKISTMDGHILRGQYAANNAKDFLDSLS